MKWIKWFADLTRHGVDVAEYPHRKPPGGTAARRLDDSCVFSGLLGGIPWRGFSLASQVFNSCGNPQPVAESQQSAGIVGGD